MVQDFHTENKGKRRLQAYLASCGVGSRRHCEDLIREGRVRVNGGIAGIGDSVEDGDIVAFDGKTLSLQTRLRYIALNKPAGFISSMNDPRGRPIAASLLGDSFGERVYNVGRLDQWSSGLLLFSNDGDLAARMTHPSGGFDKEYKIEADKDIPMELVRDFTRGIEVGGERYKAISVKKNSSRECAITLLEGRNREIRRVFEYFNIRPLRLTRVRIGPLFLGDLPEGKWRELDKTEVDRLKNYKGGSE